jgi:hypothetical protein
MENWVEGIVDINEEHIKIRYMDNDPIVLVSNSQGKIIFQFLDSSPDDHEAIEAITRELNFYFIELQKENPWLYAIYHCGTASNLYSKVHWAYYPKGFIDP